MSKPTLEDHLKDCASFRKENKQELTEIKKAIDGLREALRRRFTDRVFLFLERSNVGKIITSTICAIMLLASIGLVVSGESKALFDAIINYLNK